jgi:hypothetical protein
MGSEPLRVWAGDLSDVDVHGRSERLATHPIVRAHLDDRLDATELADRYGSLLTDYRLTDLDEAEIAVLPLAFERTRQVDLHRRLQQAEGAGLRTLTFSIDDLEPLMPSDSMVLLHPGPTRGAQRRGMALAVPYVFTDRANGSWRREATERPTVAFCGQGTSRRGASLALTARRALASAQNRLKPNVVTPPVRGHVSLRARALRSLHNDPRVDDRFVIRDQYRAGAVSDAERSQTQADFDDNLRSASYALCVRGTGNFSARFYEALSFGRIPLFVDTSCILPFEDEVDWRQRCVWIERSQIDRISDLLVTAHDADDPSSPRSVDSLRSLWEQRLTQDGFFRHFVGTVRRWTS